MVINSSGNVGIGTWTPFGKFIILGGNVGIGSNVPGQALDVQGTIRDIGEFVNGNVGIGTSSINGTGEAALNWVALEEVGLLFMSSQNNGIGLKAKYHFVHRALQDFFAALRVLEF